MAPPSFARRYGLREKPLLVRFRILDPRFGFGLAARDGAIAFRVAQLALLAEDFARLFAALGTPPFEQVFITENEINFLVFPDQSWRHDRLRRRIRLRGLARADWLRTTAGCATGAISIPTASRSWTSSARTSPRRSPLLMDRATLLAHRGLWTAEGTPTKAELGRLRPEERELYDELRADRLAPSLRLEQERIGFSWVESALATGLEWQA